MLKIENLRVKKGSFLLEVDFLEVETHEFIGVLGPSGSGKTTLLETIAGFIEPESGKITFYGHDITRIPPWRRHIAITYEEPHLFPHLTVFQNLTYGKDACEKFVLNLSERLGISDLLERYPRELSAGQKQKVSIIRACASRPMMLLLDEPFNFLDPMSKEELRNLLREIKEEFLMPIILVTHDLEEAFYHSDRIILLENGEIKAIGTSYDLVMNPPCEFVMSFLGKANYIPVDSRESRFFVGSQEIVLPSNPDKKKFVVMLRPQDIILTRDPSGKGSARNHLKGKVSDIIRGQKVNEVKVDVEGITVLVYITDAALEELSLEQNESIYLTFKATALRIFDSG
ncbi:MAG: ABC transporter ATP-binding protein [candidate division WOR-3 bacterium]